MTPATDCQAREFIPVMTGTLDECFGGVTHRSVGGAGSHSRDA